MGFSYLLVVILKIGVVLGLSRTPEQVHISVTQDPSQMNIQWTTDNTVNLTVCIYGLQSNVYSFKVNGTSSTYTGGEFKGKLHNAVLQNLNPGTQYYYTCGDGIVMSKEWSFKTRTIGQSTVSLAVIGDMGTENSANTIKWMTADTENRIFDLLIHYGDISYADDHGVFNNSYINDLYMNSIERIAARIPYMVATGNHDTQFEYAAYLNRWVMPTKPKEFWYSFDYGSVHFLAFSTEHDFSKGSVQNKWIEDDLKKAFFNKKNVPWIIVYGHRPLYCTSLALFYRCDFEAPEYREALEDYFYKYQVDIYFSGHNHNYERTYPVYKLVATNTTSAKEYYNPKAPVYVLQGAAGNIEPLDPTDSWPGPSWRAGLVRFHYGYGRLKMTPNRLDWEFVQVSHREGKVVDSFSIIRS